MPVWVRRSVAHVQPNPAGASPRAARVIRLGAGDAPGPKPDGWLIQLDLRDDFDKIREAYENQDLPQTLIRLREIELRVHVGDENWVSPVGFFDPDFLVEPGILSNVENGFGFFGSGYMESTVFAPSRLLQGRAGFFVSGG